MRSTRSISALVASASLAVMLFGAAPALAAGVAPAQATPVQREQAQSRFLRGKEKLAKGQHADALAEFSASLDIVASPNTRLYVGRCLRDMGRLVAAYVELGRTEVEAKELAREDPRYEKAAQSAHEERAKLEPKLAFINVDIAHGEPATTLKVGGDEIRPGGWSEPIPVLPGTAEVIVETPGRAPIQRSVQIASSERKSIAIDAAEGAPAAVVVVDPPQDHPSPSAGPMRNMAYVAGGAAVVGLGMFAFFGLKANGTYSDLEKACNSGPCPPERDAQISEGRTQQTTANIGLAVFVIGAAATATLWVLSSPKSDRGSTNARIDVGPSFTGVRGAF
jgi:hypothetical protein